MPNIGFWATAGAGGAAAGDYELIETQILTSTVASVTFSSIPQTYKHLQVRLTARSARTGAQIAYAGLRLNGDTAGNYAYHVLNTTGASVISQSGVTQSRMTIGQMPTIDSNADIYGASIFDLLDYANTNVNTTMRSRSGVHNTTSYAELNSGVWLNTAAITSVNVFAQSVGWISGSRFSLYGIKG